MDHTFQTAESLAASEKFQRHCLQADEASSQYWEEWLSRNPEKQALFQEAQMIVSKLSLLPDEAEIAKEWSKLEQAIEQPVADVQVLRPRRTLSWAKWAVAASITLLLGLGIWQWQFSTPNLIQLSTTYGQTQEISLQDGTVVTVNSNSNIRYAPNWDEKEEREIWLDGEAFFHVSKQNGKAFIVHTTEGDIQVLGTQFNVARRETHFSVTLMEGKVALKRAQQAPIAMKPGEQVFLAGDHLERKLVDLETVAAWRFDKMIFKNTPIAAIIEQLENDFGWKVEVKDPSILGRKVKAEIPRNSPELLLEALSAIYNLEITTLGDKEFLIE
ncbi:MAG: FecR domain-containing protein [Bacteroidota bacterium]